MGLRCDVKLYCHENADVTFEVKPAWRTRPRRWEWAMLFRGVIIAAGWCGMQGRAIQAACDAYVEWKERTPEMIHIATWREVPG